MGEISEDDDIPWDDVHLQELLNGASHFLTNLEPTTLEETLHKLIEEVNPWHEYENIPEPESVRMQVVQMLQKKIQRIIEDFRATGNVEGIVDFTMRMRPFALVSRGSVLLGKTDDIGVGQLSGAIVILDLLRHYHAILDESRILEASYEGLMARYALSSGAEATGDSSNPDSIKDLNQAAELCDLLKGKIPESERRTFVVRALVHQSQEARRRSREDSGILDAMKELARETSAGDPWHVSLLSEIVVNNLERLKQGEEAQWDDELIDDTVPHLTQLRSSIPEAQQMLATIHREKSRRSGKASSLHLALCYERGLEDVKTRLEFIDGLVETGDPELLLEAIATLGELRNEISMEDTECITNFIHLLTVVGRSTLTQDTVFGNTDNAETRRHLRTLLSQIEWGSFRDISDFDLALSRVLTSSLQFYEEALSKGLEVGMNKILRVTELITSQDFGPAAFAAAEACICQVLFAPFKEDDGDSGYMNQAALVLEQSSISSFQNDFDYTTHLLLGVGFMALYSRTEDHTHLDKALHHTELGVAGQKSPRDRLSSVLFWLRGALMEPDIRPPGNWDFGLGVTIDSLTQLAGLRTTVAKRHRLLRNLPRELQCVITILIDDGDLARALESLERVRGLVWTQLRNLRAPLDDLRSVHPAFAERLKCLSRGLETAGRRIFPPEEWLSGTDEAKIERQEEEAAHHQMAEEYDDIVHTIRTTIPGFEEFLRPPCLADWLENLPPTGLVAWIIVSELGCDAIILKSGTQPDRIPLVDFALAEAEELQSHFRSSLQENNLIQREREECSEDSRVARPAKRARTHNQVVSSILKNLWILVVKPILEKLNLARSETNQQRIWWCPTGPLTSLPLHAAGIYEGSLSESVSDYVVSSYIPTISTLVDRFKRSPKAPSDMTGVCMVSQAAAPGLPVIPGTRDEIARVAAVVGGEPGVVTIQLEDAACTKDAVLDAMKKHGWIHLACHGSQHSKEPLKSGFALADGRLELSTIIENIFENAEFAFLSACQTSTGDIMLSEEAVHLAAAMLVTGYQGVVGTMWSINDRHAPQLAEDFYRNLLERSVEVDGKKRLDPTQAAPALHYAVQKLRERVGDSNYLLWAPYVHFGL